MKKSKKLERIREVVKASRAYGDRLPSMPSPKAFRNKKAYQKSMRVGYGTSITRRLFYMHLKDAYFFAFLSWKKM